MVPGVLHENIKKCLCSVARTYLDIWIWSLRYLKLVRITGPLLCLLAFLAHSLRHDYSIHSVFTNSISVDLAGGLLFIYFGLSHLETI